MSFETLKTKVLTEAGCMYRMLRCCRMGDMVTATTHLG
ncbi:UNVERIFIED_ORG: hypothetical protein BCL66_102297 [Martelella mediterranea]